MAKAGSSREGSASAEPSLRSLMIEGSTIVYEALRDPLLASQHMLEELRNRLGARDLDNCYVFDSLSETLVLTKVLRSAVDDFLKSPNTMRA